MEVKVLVDKEIVLEAQGLGKEVSSPEGPLAIVRDVLTAVRAEGVSALLRYAREFDKVELTEATLRVTAEEIATIKEQISESEDAERPKVSFEVGETVKINDGPFLNFTGVIEEVEPDKGKLKVTVDIFGRKTPVELEYWQVEKS